MAEIVRASGSLLLSMCSISSSTEVSIIPRACLATRRWILIGNGINIFAKLLEIDRGRALKGSQHRRCGYERTSPQRGQFADWNAVSSHDEALSGIECPHDLAAVVSQLSLRDFAAHGCSVARVLQIANPSVERRRCFAEEGRMAKDPSQGLDLSGLAAALRKFARDRDWEQFHTPKNLASALVVEAVELLENFQWLTGEESCRLAEHPVRFERVRDELADVMIYAVRLADVLDIDLPDAIAGKIEQNAKKYPVEKSKGIAAKYTDL